MSGHNKWAQIKHQKGATDKKRGVVFSKLSKAISVAAKTEPNPDFNPRLRSAIETAKQNNVPQNNIDRAISKGSEEKNLEELAIEAYGPEKVALIIEAATDNRNRTTNEIRNLLADNGGKMGEMGSARWAFSAEGGSSSRGESSPAIGWTPKFTQTVSEDGKAKLQHLLEILEAHDDVQRVTTNQQ